MIEALFGLVGGAGLAYGLFERYRRFHVELYCQHQRQPQHPTLTEDRVRVAHLETVREHLVRTYGEQR